MIPRSFPHPDLRDHAWSWVLLVPVRRVVFCWQLMAVGMRCLATCFCYRTQLRKKNIGFLTTEFFLLFSHMVFEPISWKGGRSSLVWGYEVLAKGVCSSSGSKPKMAQRVTWASFGSFGFSLPHKSPWFFMFHLLPTSFSITNLCCKDVASIGQHGERMQKYLRGQDSQCFDDGWGVVHIQSKFSGCGPHPWRCGWSSKPLQSSHW